MSDNLSTQLPNPPELQPISSTASKIWRGVSLFLTVGGLALMSVGGWIFVQQQIEANKPPPARVLEVSVADVESAEPLLSDALHESANPIEDELVTTAAETRVDPVGRESAQPAGANAGPDVGVEEDVDPESVPEVSSRGETVSLTEAKLFEEAALSQEEGALTSEPEAADSSLSLADNPLLVVEEERDSAGGVESAGGESGDSAGTQAEIERPLARIVAESIGLDADVVEVGWQTVIQNGVAANVWVVADFAAGWHRNSKLPGQGGNIVMSAHHNIKGEVFRYTLDLEPGDIVTLYDETQTYDYRVEDKFLVKDKGESEAVRRENAKWIGPFNEERLTLVTCWPYNSNTHRLIVIAKPVGEEQALGQ